MSGRGLGHTGGTLDKLESIPGFRVELSQDEFIAQVREVGMAIIGQTADLVPADKRLYALRDVTATVDQVGLIAASIMSKKIAAGADAIVLDVKVGDGAFMKTLDEARELADAMVALGREAGREVVCELTDMDQPLGRAVGNARRDPRGGRDAARRGPARPDRAGALRGRVTCSRSPTSTWTRTKDGGSARRRSPRARAVEAYERWIRAQGGDPSLDALPVAPVVHEVAAPDGGFVERIAATRIGLASLELGAGRVTKDDEIDHAVGVVCLAKRGDEIGVGEPLARIHARDQASADAAAGGDPLGRTSSVATAPPGARDRAGGRSVAFGPCPSCPRSRPSARSSSPG